MSKTLLNKLKKIVDLKRQEIALPISKKKVLLSPLCVDDNYKLKLILATPSTYDSELLKLIYTKIQFPLDEKKPSFEDFCRTYSYFDKAFMLRGLYDISFNGQIGKFPAKCPACDEKFEETLTVNNTYDPTSVVQWEHPESYLDFRHQIVFDNLDPETEMEKIIINVKVPSIDDMFKVLTFVRKETIQLNLKTFGSPYSNTEIIAQATESIDIFNIDGTTDSITSKKDIYEGYKLNNIPLEIGEKVIEEWDRIFDKYIPVFKKNLECPKCGHVADDFNIQVNYEQLFFERGTGIK